MVSLRRKQAPRIGIASAKAQRLKNLLIDLWARKAARAHAENKHSEAIELLERVRGQLSLGGLLLLARARYRNGNLAQAIEVTDEVDRQWPKCAAVLVNRAFFATLAMNHGEMLDRYDELRRLPAVAVDVNLVEVHEFLWEESRHAPENFGLIFAAGMVSRFFDPRTARRDFQEFLRKSARGHRWKLLRTRADGELGALRKKGG